MKTRLAICIISALFAVPCFAGDLEKGISLHGHNDYAGAIAAFDKAAAGGNAEAQRRLGFMYYHGEGVAQDNKRAVTLFESAAKAGDAESARNLGTMYEHGMSVDQSDALAAA